MDDNPLAFISNINILQDSFRIRIRIIKDDRSLENRKTIPLFTGSRIVQFHELNHYKVQSCLLNKGSIYSSLEFE